MFQIYFLLGEREVFPNNALKWHKSPTPGMSSLRNTVNTTFSSSGSQESSLIKYEAGSAYYGLFLAASKTAFLPWKKSIFLYTYNR